MATIPETLFPDYIPSEASPRFSFANTHALRIDTTYTHGRRNIRVLTYPRPEEDTVAICVRNAATIGGYLLGQEIENPDASVISFTIPGASRPTKNSAPHAKEGGYNYGDSNLFSDMGTVLARLALLSPDSPVVIDRAIGLNTAVLDFTRVAEQRLLLVPGFELGLRHVENDDKAVDYYTEKIENEFESRFSPHIPIFRDAFREQIETQLN